MNDIIKQRFLAELGKLLTFMYEEDRLTALDMYERMFDEAEDERALMELLVSPTKQAVTIARAYDAKERKLQVETQSRKPGEEPEATPRYVLTIDAIYQKLQRKAPEEAPVSQDQFSLFEEVSSPVREEDFVPFPSKTPEQPAPEERPAPAEGEDAQVEKFLEGYSVVGDELAEPEKEGGRPAEEEQAAPVGEPAPVPSEEPEEAPLLSLPEEEPAPSAPVKTVRKAKPFLLALFILLAIPLTLITLLVLLLPTLLSLGLAVGTISAGAVALVSAFSGFTMFADIMIVLGAALVILALGLLFLWLFVWLIGGAMVGLVRGVIELGRSWCYEEVAE